MSYTKTTWVNNQAPAINADNLNHMEQGIESAHNQIDINTSDIDSLETQVQTNTQNITSETSTRQSQDSLLQSQIDQLVAPTGEAPTPAEIENARIGDDGVTYDTLGNAIRGQFSDLKSTLGKFFYTQTKTSRVMDFNIPVSSGDVIYLKAISWTGDSFTSINLNGYNGSYITLDSTITAVGQDTFYVSKNSWQSLRVSVGTASAPSTPQTLSVILVNLGNVSDVSQNVIKNKYDIKGLTEDAVGNIQSFANNRGAYITSSNTVSSNASLRHSDYIPIPENAIAIKVYNKTTIGGNIYHISPCVLFYDANKTLISYSSNTTDDLVTESIPTDAKYIRFNQSNEYPDAPNAYVHFVKFSFTKAIGLWGHFSGAFASKQSINTKIVLKPNTDYIIKYNSKITGRTSNYNGSASSVYKTTAPWINTCIYSNGATEGYLYVYNSESQLDSIDIDVYELGAIGEKATRVPTVYVVDKNVEAFGSYTSLTQCLLDLKDDDSEKIIYINGGDYDIYQEYVDANVPVYTGDNPSLDYWDYNVFIPKNTHIIGRGLVRLMWMPDAGDITVNQSKTVSPVNVAGAMTLENVEIHCKNGRYCIHDDPLGKIEFTNAEKKYINVKCYKYANDSGYGFAPVIGFGIDAQMSYLFQNCLFKNYGNERAFYMHNRVTTYGKRESSNIVVNDSVLDCGSASMCVKFGNTGDGGDLRIRVSFNSCYIGGAIHLINEGAATPVVSNTFDLSLVRCNEGVSVVVADTDNQYPPKIY